MVTITFGTGEIDGIYLEDKVRFKWYLRDESLYLRDEANCVALRSPRVRWYCRSRLPCSRRGHRVLAVGGARQGWHAQKAHVCNFPRRAPGRDYLWRIPEGAHAEPQ